MQINRFDHRIDRHLLFILILLVHVAIILLWQNKLLPSYPPVNTNKILLLLSLPQQKSIVEVSKQKTIREIKPRSTTQLASKKNNSKSESITVTSQTQEPSSQAEVQVPPLTIQKNIRELSLGLRDDFLKQEKNYRPDSKSSTENIRKFSNALVDAAQVQREGVIIEKKFAYDGRPVSKVKTPYGTYCVRHPKAGEKLELSPPPLRVSCGQL
jgi:hypothetical protein